MRYSHFVLYVYSSQGCGKIQEPELEFNQDCCFLLALFALSGVIQRSRKAHGFFRDQGNDAPEWFVMESRISFLDVFWSSHMCPRVLVMSTSLFCVHPNLRFLSWHNSSYLNVCEVHTSLLDEKLFCITNCARSNTCQICFVRLFGLAVHYSQYVRLKQEQVWCEILSRPGLALGTWQVVSTFARAMKFYLCDDIQLILCCQLNSSFLSLRHSFVYYRVLFWEIFVVNFKGFGEGVGLKCLFVRADVIRLLDRCVAFTLGDWIDKNYFGQSISYSNQEQY